jgi:hypothetical protein
MIHSQDEFSRERVTACIQTHEQRCGFVLNGMIFAPGDLRRCLPGSP